MIRSNHAILEVISIDFSPFSSLQLVFDNESHTRTPDLGVGLSLVFLLAKTSDEFNKMAKVRAEMETLLREIKEQVRQSSSGVSMRRRNPAATSSPPRRAASRTRTRTRGRARA